MFSVINATLPIFALILLGFLCAKGRLFAPSAIDVLNRFVVYLALPAVLFAGMAKTSVAELMNVNFMGAFGLSMMATFIIAFVLARRAKSSLTDANIEGFAAAYPNTGFIGIPLMMIAMGPASLPATVIASFLVICVLMAVTITLIEIAQQETKDLGKTATKVGLSLVKNPLVIAPLLGVLCAVLGITLPAPVEKFATLLAGAATPCALITIGLFLAEKQEASSNIAVTRLFLLKMFFQPGLTAILALTIFKMSPLLTQSAILLSALPIGTGPFMLAKLYKRDAGVSSRAILLTTVSSVITLSALMAWFRQQA
jgi:malonate transporter